MAAGLALEDWKRHRKAVKRARNRTPRVEWAVMAAAMGVSGLAASAVGAEPPFLVWSIGLGGGVAWFASRRIVMRRLIAPHVAPVRRAVGELGVDLSPEEAATLLRKRRVTLTISRYLIAIEDKRWVELKTGYFDTPPTMPRDTTPGAPGR